MCSAFCQVGQSPRLIFQSFNTLQVGRRLALWAVVVGRADAKFMEDSMKSLSELAAIYEKWATANEAAAEELLGCVDSLLTEQLQEQQRWRASQLRADAAALKIRAKDLRELEGGIVGIIQDGYKDPQDEDQCCDGPQAIWRSKRVQ